MFDQFHELWLAMGLNQSIVWLTLSTGIVTGALTATYVDLALWKGITISLAAVTAAVVTLPWMYPFWSMVASRGGLAGLASGSSDHLTWIGVSAVAALAGALVGGRINAPVSEAVWVVCVSSVAMYVTHGLLLRI